MSVVVSGFHTVIPAPGLIFSLSPRPSSEMIESFYEKLMGKKTVHEKIGGRVF